MCSWFGRPNSNHPKGQRYHFFDLKIPIYYSHFSSIFCRNCQIQCFLDTVNAISKRLKCLSYVFASNSNLSTSTLWNSSNSVQKALDLTILAKNRRKMRIINLNFHVKKLIPLACRVFEIRLPNHLHKAWFFVKCKCSNSYSVWLKSFLTCNHIWVGRGKWVRLVWKAIPIWV